MAGVFSRYQLVACWAGRLRAPSKPIDISTSVAVSFERINPHVLFTLEERHSDGQVRLWRVEGPGLNSFNRRGLGEDFLQPGEEIEVCGFGFKEEVLARNGGLDARGMSRPWLHGYLLVSPDGQMRLFGGYGKLDNCVRPDDQVRLGDVPERRPRGRRTLVPRARLHEVSVARPEGVRSRGRSPARGSLSAVG